jgi:uroporphyrinogen-III decarboxylase
VAKIMQMFDYTNKPNIDYSTHNDEVRKVWKTFYEGNPERIPMVIGMNPRFLLLDPKYNKKGITFQEYFDDPEIMWNVQLEHCDFVRHNIFADNEMGIPEMGWTVNIDFQNTVEAPWLGCPIMYPDANVPSTIPFLNDDNKNELLHRGIPNPFSGIMGKAKKYAEIFNEKIQNGYIFKGTKIANVNNFFLGTDGVFTLACNLRGTQEFCIDLYEDTKYALDMLEMLTQAIITRIKAWRKYYGLSEKSKAIWFADDSIALLSTETYKEFVLPFHKKMIEELSDGSETNFIHLCGNSSHHFITLRDELNIYGFDTGYPIKHGELVKKLGPDVMVQGGPRVNVLLFGTVNDVISETKRIIDEVKPHTKKFIMREANNLSPFTPLSNVEAMHNTVRTYGIF